ncbi:MAG TPA: hypothetical protein VFC42_10300 [Methylomirabilota bacterium]|nr:hypothetical protein [Methylomirabilota bacterium]
MADWRPAARGHRLRMTIEALLAIGLALVVASGLPGRPGANDRWGSLVGAADREASTPRTADPDAARRARIRYLLAFHDAQDAADPEHVLAIADRLERGGEPALAAHVRRAARALFRELGAEVATPPPPGGG